MARPVINWQAFSRPRLRAVDAYLRANLFDPRRLSEATAARIARVTPEHLCRLFRVHVGACFIDWQHAVRIEEGKNLIVIRSLPLKRVHGLVGYARYETFSRAFKKCEGVTATQLQRFIFEYPELASVVCSQAAAPVFHIAQLTKTDPEALRLLRKVARRLLRYQTASRKR